MRKVNIAILGAAGRDFHNFYNIGRFGINSNIWIVNMVPCDWKGLPDYFFDYSNIFKLGFSNNIRIFPSDPTGSLDDFYSVGVF